jgi:hypothetical protein
MASETRHCNLSTKLSATHGGTHGGTHGNPTWLETTWELAGHWLENYMGTTWNNLERPESDLEQHWNDVGTTWTNPDQPATT